ncbi:MAG TPA: class I SAM-dependent methyltransferase [Actinomycetota bacterium]|nr:class I SAM-dependent methyltransferase [Actinomycetota bacterium]
MAEIDPDWYYDFFQDRYLQIAGQARSAEPTAQECDFLQDALEITPPARVLDLACGHGRHSIELARRGLHVTGIDLSEPSLQMAQQAAEEAGIHVELLHKDMRELDFNAEFDAVINMFTAFGYFSREEDDLHVLALVAKALRPKGGFLLDVANTVRIFREYAGQAHRVLDDGTTMIEDRSYDGATGRNNVVWTFIAPDGSKSELNHSVRMYTLPELMGLLSEAGLTFERAWGDFDGSVYSAFESRRLIVKAVRP